MGRPACPLHDAGNYRADGRKYRHQPARSGILIKQARAEHHGDDQRQLHHSMGQHRYKLLIIDELGFVPLSKTGAELLFELISQRYERGSTLITSNLPFDEWTETFGSERLTGALLDRLTHHVSILEMNGESYRLAHSTARKRR
ncbi:ATP-binding protein [Sinirhodobacter huangdaonensis]|uniref:ATP-binding protein n=1 Tax=Paenirhodobacter huangdaonensis TaxID=2501515 RepID=UPI0023B2A859|nr:ATP-binding protein [Sinirhodobacter huangdaonensis]